MYVGSAEDVLSDLIETIAPDHAQHEKAAATVITRLEDVAKALGFRVDRNKEGSLIIACGPPYDPVVVYVAYNDRFIVWRSREVRTYPGLRFKRYANEPKFDFVGTTSHTDPESGLEVWEPGVDALARAVVELANQKPD